MRAWPAAITAVLLLGAGCSNDEEDPAAFCSYLRGATAVNAPVQALDLSDQASVDAAVADLENLRRLAPAEIAGDVEVVMSTYEALIEALALTAETARDDAIRQFDQQFSDALEPARRLNEYTTENCALDLNVDQELPTPTPETVDTGREG